MVDEHQLICRCDRCDREILRRNATLEGLILKVEPYHVGLGASSATLYIERPGAKGPRQDIRICLRCLEKLDAFMNRRVKKEEKKL